MKSYDPRILTSFQGKTLVWTTVNSNLYDLGDGVLCFEIANKNATISMELTADMDKAREKMKDENWAGMILCSARENFCIGQDLRPLLQGLQLKIWGMVTEGTRRLQNVYRANKYSAKPIVAAISGMALGGGCELAMQTAAIQAAGKTYMGFVEVGVGLLPGGGGVTEMALRAAEKAGVSGCFAERVADFLQNIAMGEVSKDAAGAVIMGYLRASDRISMEKGQLIADAKTRVLELVQSGYRPPEPIRFAAPGPEAAADLLRRAEQRREAGEFSEHDLLIFKKLVYTMFGGSAAAGTIIDDQYLLELECEAFVSLCGETKTYERVMHMLETGKRLRN